MAQEMVSIPGTEKQPFRNAKVIANAPSDERLEVTVRLRPKNPLPDSQDLLKFSSTPMAQLTPDQYDAQYGADPKDIATVTDFATKHNLTVVRASVSRRSVILSGTVTDFNGAFGVDLKSYAYAEGTYRGRTGPIQIPAALAPVVEGVFGLDNRPVARRHSSLPAAINGPQVFTGADLAKIYNFPAGTDGTGQTIGIIELGGGYQPADLDRYFSGLGVKTPTVIPVSVDGGANSPTSASSDDSEVVLDIQVAGAAAPGARLVVYFASGNDDSSFLDALTKAIHDTENNPSVISISWGGPEVIPNSSFQLQFDQALQAAALLGITVCVAAGDNGAADMDPLAPWDGLAHVDFPSASPFSLSCGGTRLILNNGAIASESVWNQNKADLSQGETGSFGASGGGVSGAFSVPGYQQQANVPVSLNPAGYKGRGVPDVTGNGDPQTGYNVLVDGQKEQYGGTSAVAPLWAALIARINQKLQGRVGFINPQLYALHTNAAAFHNVSQGSNRVSYGAFNNIGYDAGAGWNAASGLGSPDGTVLCNLLMINAPAPPAVQAQARSAVRRPVTSAAVAVVSPGTTRKKGTKSS
jgi:kumamolisin